MRIVLFLFRRFIDHLRQPCRERPHWRYGISGRADGAVYYVRFTFVRRWNFADAGP